MEERRFDALAKSLARPVGRRGILKGMVAAVLGSVVAGGGAEAAKPIYPHPPTPDDLCLGQCPTGPKVAVAACRNACLNCVALGGDFYQGECCAPIENDAAFFVNGTCVHLCNPGYTLCGDTCCPDSMCCQLSEGGASGTCVDCCTYDSDCGMDGCCIEGVCYYGYQCYPSDREIKADFATVDPQAILDGVVSLPLTTWRYKSDDGAIRHLGPMAQDFAATFGLGDSDRHIHVVDSQGVTLAAIQGLSQQLQAQAERVAQLEAELARLRGSIPTCEPND